MLKSISRNVRHKPEQLKSDYDWTFAPTTSTGRNRREIAEGRVEEARRHAPSPPPSVEEGLPDEGTVMPKFSPSPPPSPPPEGPDTGPCMMQHNVGESNRNLVLDAFRSRRATVSRGSVAVSRRAANNPRRVEHVGKGENAPGGQVPAGV